MAVGTGSSVLGRATKGVIDWLLDGRWTRDPVSQVGRYLFHRANGDNDQDMARNGELALLERLPTLFAGRPAVVFDVGANLGDWTRSAHRRLAPGSTIYAFEPVASVYAELQPKLAALEPGTRVVATNAALSDRDGCAEIWMYGGGASALHDRSFAALAGVPARREEVRLVCGDTFCREHSIERIGFLKIDVEGHELAVFRGFAGMLAKGRVDALQFEYGGTWIDARSWLRDAFELLQGHGYALGKLFRGGVHWYPRYAVNLETFQYANYVAVRPPWQESLSRS